jgi:hypothetical protein
VAVRFADGRLGDPRPATELFAIDCPEPGVARWADERSWPTTRRRTCRPASPAASRSAGGKFRGRGAAGRREFRHDRRAGRATAQPWPGQRIAEDQRFVLRLDAPAEPRSVEAHAHFQVEGLPEPVGARVVTGADRDEVVKRTTREPSPADLVLEARQRFPAGRRVELVWGRGVATPSGIATREAQRFEFRVRDALALQIPPARERARGLPAARRWANHRPVASDAARRIRLRRWRACRAAAEPGYDEDAGALPQYADPRPSRRTAATASSCPPSCATTPDGLPPPTWRALEIEVATLCAAKFAARFGVEAAAPALPVTLRRIEPEAEGAARSTRRRRSTPPRRRRSRRSPRLRAASPWEWSTRQQSIFERVPEAHRLAARPRFSLPPAASTDSTEVIGVPLDGLGLHAVEIESRALGLSHLGADRPMYASAVALVTNLSVHFKWGREGSLAWVTSLDRARPTAGASVAVFDCAAKQLASGTDRRGRPGGSRAADSEAATYCSGNSSYDSGLLVMARLGADVSFVHTSWEEGIELYRFAVPTRWEPVTALAHTILDRALFRAGETVAQKHLLRRPVLAGFCARRPGRRLDAAAHPAPRQRDAGGAARRVRGGRQRALGMGDSEGREARGVRADAGAARGVRRGGRARARVRALPRRGVPPAAAHRRAPAARRAAGGPARRPARRGAPLPRGRAGAAARDDRCARSSACASSASTTTRSCVLSGTVQEGIERRGWWEDEHAVAAPEVRTQALVLDDAGGARQRRRPVRERRPD